MSGSPARARLGASGTELAASDGRWVRILSGAMYGIHSPTAIAADCVHLWVANGSGSVTELDASDGGWVRTLSGARYGFKGPTAITVAGGQSRSPAAAASRSCSDGRLGADAVRARYGFSAPNAITVAGGLVWVANEGDGDGRGGSVTELDAGDGGWVRTLSGARYGFNAPYSIASAHGRIWVTNLYPGIAGGSVTELNAGDGSWVATLTGGCYNFDSPHGIAVDGSHIWIANSQAPAGPRLGNETERQQRRLDPVLLGRQLDPVPAARLLPGVLASGGFHFSNPWAGRRRCTHIWVFGRDRVRVLTDPAARPAAAVRP